MAGPNHAQLADDSPIVVTGASGFIALHLVCHLLREGCRVRGTLRTPTREAELRRAIELEGVATGRLEYVEADLESDDGWSAAMAGARHVFHVASPIPTQPPRSQRALLGPAVDGTLRVLRAAHEQGARRVVVTSSISAVFSGHARDGSRSYSELDWSIEGPKTPAYDLSKTQAERAAWKFVGGLSLDSPLELVAINPGFVFGPPIGATTGITNQVIKKLISKEIPGVPRLGCAPVDVRDIADAHVRAMVTPAAAGERFCCATPHLWYAEVAALLAQDGYDVPSRLIPNWLFWLVAQLNAQTRVVLPELGLRWDIDASKAERMLGWKPRPAADTILDTAAKLASMLGISKSR